jgi:hypothetical protein
VFSVKFVPHDVFFQSPIDFDPLDMSVQKSGARRAGIGLRI